MSLTSYLSLFPKPVPLKITAQMLTLLLPLDVCLQPLEMVVDAVNLTEGLV